MNKGDFRVLMLAAASLLLIRCQAIADDAPATQPDTETVLVTHRVRAGQEAEYLKLLAQQWAALSKHRLVLDRPHMVLRGEEGGKPVFVEIFTWISRDAPENVPPDVQAIWDSMGKLVEKRNGHQGIEFPEVHEVDLPAPGK